MDPSLLTSNSRDPSSPPQPPSPQAAMSGNTPAFERASSISGSIVGCMQGYVSLMNSQASSGGMVLEISQFPDGLRTTTSSVPPAQFQGERCDFGYSVEWAKLFNMNLVFSFQQVGLY